MFQKFIGMKWHDTPIDGHSKQLILSNIQILIKVFYEKSK